MGYALIITNLHPPQPTIVWLDKAVETCRFEAPEGEFVNTAGGFWEMRKLYPETKYQLALLCDQTTLMLGSKERAIMELMHHIGNQSGRLAGVIIPPTVQCDEQLAIAQSRYPELYQAAIEPSLPCILAIETDFDTFNPQKDQWAIVRLSDLFDKSGMPNAALSEIFARSLVDAIQSKKSIFDFLYEASIDRNRKKLIDSFELAPKVCGVGVDLKKWLSLRMPANKE